MAKAIARGLKSANTAKSGKGAASHPKPSIASSRRPAPAAKKSPAEAKKKPVRAIIDKSLETIDSEFQKLDLHDGMKSQDRERAERALSQIMSSLEKAIDMQSDLAKSARRGAKKADAETLAHAENLRREIAERIERINRSQRNRKNSE